jgi:hypothetical protein
MGIGGRTQEGSGRLLSDGQGAQPVRDFILGLPREDRRLIGNDIATVEYECPVVKPTCAPLGLGLWCAAVWRVIG